MTVLQVRSFGGEVPRLTKRDLPDNAGQLALNLMADTPEFRPLGQDMTGLPLGLLPPGETARTIYRYPTSSTSLIGTALRLSLVKASIPGDPYDRVYASTRKDETQEIAPHVLQAGVAPGSPSLRPLGVPYPTGALTLAQATIGDALTKPSEAAAIGQSLLQQIRDICYEAVETYNWNPLFDLSGRPGFRADPANGASGVWQRIFTRNDNTVPHTWNTYNGLGVERFLWTLEQTNPPFKQDAPGVYTFFFWFPAFARLMRVKADTSVQEAKLRALVLPGTTERILSDAEITALFTVLRAVYPADPQANTHPELVALAGRMGAAYVSLVEYLDKGFDTSVSPQAGYQLVARAWEDLVTASDGIASFYQQLRDVAFGQMVVDHFNGTRAPGKLPEGELEEVEVLYYTWTLVNPWGEESKPYLPGDGNSDEDLPYLEKNQTQAVAVTRPSALPAGVDGTWKWRLYRSAAGAQAAGFFFVAELPMSVTEFVDLRSTDSLSEGLQTTSWFPPPEQDGRHLRGLVQMPGQFLAGFLDNTVYFSEPGHPYAWPRQYAIPLEADVAGMAVFGATLVVLTYGRPAFITGSSPEGLSRDDLESIESVASCGSITPVTGGVVFASQNGLCLASQQGIQNLTRNLYTREDWAAIGPESLLAGEYDGVIYFTRPTKGDMQALHAATGKLVTLDINPTALYQDHSRGVLCVALAPAPGQAATATLLHYGTGPKAARWRSKRITLGAEAPLAWMAVLGEQSPAQPLTVDVRAYYADPATGAEVQVLLRTARGNGTYSAVVGDTRPFRVQAGRYKEFEIEVSGSCRVTAVALASSTQELQEVI